MTFLRRSMVVGLLFSALALGVTTPTAAATTITPWPGIMAVGSDPQQVQPGDTAAVTLSFWNRTTSNITYAYLGLHPIYGPDNWTVESCEGCSVDTNKNIGFPLSGPIAPNQEVKVHLVLRFTAQQTAFRESDFDSYFYYENAEGGTDGIYPYALTIKVCPC